MPEGSKQRLAERINTTIAQQGLNVAEKWEALPEQTRALIEEFKSGELSPIDYANGKFSPSARAIAETLSTTPKQLFGFDERAYDSALGTLKSDQRAALILRAKGNSDEEIAYAIGKNAGDISRLVEFARTTISHRCDSATKLKGSFSQESYTAFIETGKSRSEDLFLNFWPRLQNRTRQMSPDIFAGALENFVRISLKRPQLNKFSAIGITDQQLLDENNTAFRPGVSPSILARVLKCFESLERKPSRSFLTAVEKFFKSDQTYQEHLKDSPFCQDFIVKPAPAPPPVGADAVPPPPEP